MSIHYRPNAYHLEPDTELTRRYRMAGGMRKRAAVLLQQRPELLELVDGLGTGQLSSLVDILEAERLERQRRSDDRVDGPARDVVEISDVDAAAAFLFGEDANG